MPSIRLVIGAALLTFVHSPARAQAPGANIELQAFRPAIDSRGFITINSPQTLDSGRVAFGIVSSWAKGLLRFEDGDNVYEVQHFLTPTLVAALGVRALGIPMELAIAAPFHVMAGDRSPNSDGGTPDDPNDDEQFGFQGQGLGDIAMHIKVALAGQERLGLGLGLVGTLTVPTATESNAWMGQGGVTGQLTLVAERRLGRLRVGANGGLRYLPDGDREYRDSGGSALPFTGGVIQVGSTVPFGAALGYGVVPGKVDLITELFGAVPLTGENYLPLEALAGAKLYLAKSSYFTIGGGLGLAPSEGGNPDARAFLGIVFEPAPVVRQTDRIPDRVDAPPAEPPILDRDGDRIVDVEDDCPDDPEDYDDFEDQDGCPDLDNDDDKILDVDDLCPNEAEDVDRFEDADGCPELDNDNDRILDRDDQCPRIDGQSVQETAEVYNGRDDGDGCPDGRVRIDVSTQIYILDEIHFEYDSDVIRRMSFPILDEIAQTLLFNDDVRLVEVQGHTDERGSDAYNLDLSQRRSESVVRYLSEAGVAPERLQAVGYGESVPKNQAHGEKAWAENRRVEFHILKRGKDK